MITHGNKQISEIVYARKASEGGGAVLLTNIIRGAQVVFGGLYPNVDMWLKGATTAAILAAFGQTDGKAVIKATNAYLAALAATDPTKASALAGFINEDPMMVCSLVETGKTRYLVGDGKAYIKLRNVGRMSDTYDMKFKYNVGGSYRAWGVFAQSSYIPINMSLTYSAGICVRWAYNGDQMIDNLAPITSTAWHTLKIENGYVTFDRVNKGRSEGHKDGFVINYPMYLFTINPADTTPSATMNGCFEYYKHTSQEGEVMEHCIPCQHGGESGMLDLVSLTFYPNANTQGSFTIQLTNKTP